MMYNNTILIRSVAYKLLSTNELGDVLDQKFVNVILKDADYQKLQEKTQSFLDEVMAIAKKYSGA